MSGHWIGLVTAQAHHEIHPLGKDADSAVQDRVRTGLSVNVEKGIPQKISSQLIPETAFC